MLRMVHVTEDSLCNMNQRISLSWGYLHSPLHRGRKKKQWFHGFEKTLYSPPKIQKHQQHKPAPGSTETVQKLLCSI